VRVPLPERPPQSNREAQTRVMRDAIVSNKTFRNATSPPKWKLLKNWTQQIDLSLRIIQISKPGLPFLCLDAQEL
jgi:hypothetical protein